MKKALRIILLLLFIGIFAYSGWNLATYYLAAHQQEQTVSGLRKQLVEEDDSYELNAEGILKRYEKLYHDPIIFTDTPLGIYPMKATPEQYTRVMNDMQARKQVRHNRDNHDER